VVTTVAVASLALVLASAALATSQLVRHASRFATLVAGQTQTITVPFPDALKYSGARYFGHVSIRYGYSYARLARAYVAMGHQRPDLTKVKILRSGSVLGGSEFQARVRDGNPAGTAPVIVLVTATTVEPLPHS